ncbi:MAG: DUF5686 family protein [Balneolaceae bacterium]
MGTFTNQPTTLQFRRTLLSIKAAFMVAGLFFLLPLNSQAQTSSEWAQISGVVFDVEENLPLPGAHLQIAGTSMGTRTDEEGRFQLHVHPGQVQLIVSFIGMRADTLSLDLEPQEQITLRFELSPVVGQSDEAVVFADRVAQRVRELAELRNERRKQLKNYIVRVQKLGILYETRKGESEPITLASSSNFPINNAGNRSLPDDSLEAIGFSERVVEQIFVAPRTFTENAIARRSSDNFFAENEIFSTGGEPLDLNEESVMVNILGEVKTIVGPISRNAGNFYWLNEEPAGDEWPEGTIRLTLEPKTNRRPLFEGEVFINDEENIIIGMNLRLNEAGDVFTGFYSASEFHYKQRFEQIEGFWLPARTEVQTKVGIIGFRNDFVYKENWTYTGYEINTDKADEKETPLSGRTVAADAGNRSPEFWDRVSQNYTQPEDLEELEKAQSFEETRGLLTFSMDMTGRYLRSGDDLKRFYISNFSDFYRFNRVEGHYLGIGLRTPTINRNHTYKATGGIATGANVWRYNLEALQFLPGGVFGLEGSVYKRTALQFVDYPYEVGPLNMDELRYTLTHGIGGDDPRNYFEREGFSGGFRLRFREQFFIRANFMREDQRFMPITTTGTFFNSLEVGGGLDPNLNPNTGVLPEAFANQDGMAGFNPGRFSGFEFHFKFDNRQFRLPGLFRDYKVRQFGWYTDHLATWSDSQFGASAGFNYFKYRSAIGMRIPLFDSHYIFADLFVTGSDNPLPAQMQFASNGFFIEDFLRRRPVLTLGFNDAVANRTSVARLEYFLGSAFTQPMPFRAIRQSGMQMSMWVSGGVRHADDNLAPVVPWESNNQEHLEVGVAVFRILGILQVEGAFRVMGDGGSATGISIIL